VPVLVQMLVQVTQAQILIPNPSLNAMYVFIRLAPARVCA